MGLGWFGCLLRAETENSGLETKIKKKLSTPLKTSRLLEQIFLHAPSKWLVLGEPRLCFCWLCTNAALCRERMSPAARPGAGRSPFQRTLSANGFVLSNAVGGV